MFFTRQNVRARKIGRVSEVLRALGRPIGIGRVICLDPAIFKNVLSQFIPNRPPKHVIISTNRKIKSLESFSLGHGNKSIPLSVKTNEKVKQKLRCFFNKLYYASQK